MAECSEVCSTVSKKKYTDKAETRTGHPRLMMAVRTMGLRTGRKLGKGNLTIECQVGWTPFPLKEDCSHSKFVFSLDIGFQSR